MQFVSKRFLKFKKAPASLRSSVAFPAVKRSYMNTMKRFLPAMGLAATTFYFMNSPDYSPSVRFYSRFACAEEEHKLVEIEGGESLPEGEMMALKVGPEDSDKVLIAKYQGELYALSNYCSHLGVPLAHSVLFDDKVICPAHNAAFSILDGYPETAPAKNGLQKFEIIEKQGKKYVKVPSNFKDTQVVHMATRDPKNKTKFIIVGGGPAGLSAAETLRQSDFTGEIIILSNEDKVAYDRTLLSKVLAKGDPDKWIIRKQDFLDTYGIEFRTNTPVTGIDTKKKEVVLNDNTTLSYDKLLIATGGTPRVLNIPGIDLKGVHTLRTAADQSKIKAEVNDAKKVVIIGAGFIGYECAANLVSTFKGKYSFIRSYFCRILQV
jgi:nitrite reductase/ring-hydroxylating ferredoxin subunit